MRPERTDIAAPPFPGRTRWLNAERKPNLAELFASGAVLVHFFDFAQLNSIRSLPYVLAWERRYRDVGLATLGVHSPRFPFTAQRSALAPALAGLGIEHPVADDSGYELWHDYGCEGWPCLFVWGRRGALRWFHFGEGEYAATEAAIAQELAESDAHAGPPASFEPLRREDAPGALVVPPSPEVLPGGSLSEPWSREEALELSYAAGGAHASLSGSGELRVRIDGAEARTIEVAGPGLVELAAHERHEAHRLRIELGGELALYSVSFSAGLPA